MALEPKDIISIGNDILKSDADASFLLSSISRLKNGVKPTEDVLRSTKIGMHVAKLKQHKDPQVASQASALVNSWRSAIKNKEKQKGGASTNGVSASSGQNTPVKKDNPPTPASAVSSSKIRVSPEKRDANSDDINTALTSHSARDGCLKLMYNGLAHMSDYDEQPPSKILSHATAIEAAGFAYLPPIKGEPSPQYREKMRSLFQNLKNKSNPGLRRRILSGAVTPEKFVRMTDEELKSPERAAEDRQMEKENMDKAMVAKEEKSISSSLTCGKCHQKKVSYSQAQTRSADEPMTTFCECQHCKHRWKFS